MAADLRALVELTVALYNRHQDKDDAEVFAALQQARVDNWRPAPPKRPWWKLG